MYLKNATTLVYKGEMCTGCGTCLAVCPHNVFRRLNGRIEIADRDGCMECGACRKNCPAGAIYVRTGVGCATAVINRMLGRNSACCIAGDGCDTPRCC